MNQEQEQQQQQEQLDTASVRSMRSQDTEFSEESTIYNDERPDTYYDDWEDNEEEDEEEEQERTTVVRFSEQVICKATIARTDFTLREVLATWYTDEEKARLMSKYAKTCERRQAGKRPKKNSTYRGLEHFDDGDALELQCLIETCIEAVLEEQDRQVDEGIFDEEALAEISIMCTEENRDHALAMGKADEREAKKAYRQMALLDSSVHSMSSYTVGSTQDLRTLLPHNTSQQAAATTSTAIVVRQSITSPALELATGA